jgi:hypothetical protein
LNGNIIPVDLKNQGLKNHLSSSRGSRGYMKRQYIWFMILCILLSLVSYNLFGKKVSKRYSESVKRGEERQQKSDNIENELLSRYGTLELPDDLLSKGRYYIYTYGLQKFLIHDNRKPILFNGSLEDITKEGNEFIVHFKPRSLGGRISFYLKCKDGYANSILKNQSKQRRKYDLEEYWVVCRVTEVNKVSEVDTPELYSIKGEVIEMVKI